MAKKAKTVARIGNAKWPIKVAVIGYVLALLVHLGYGVVYLVSSDAVPYYNLFMPLFFLGNRLMENSAIESVLPVDLSSLPLLLVGLVGVGGFMVYLLWCVRLRL